jgi:anti-sigma B factor antagonist
MAMRLQVQGDTLSIDGVKELNAANAASFWDQVRAAMSEPLRNIEIDLSQATFLDSSALGALISLHKTACHRHGLVRLMNPAIAVQQVLELTRLHRLFEIVQN